ncbi:MAG: alkaline phosphatase D family protein [Bacteroidota bacterium]
MKKTLTVFFLLFSLLIAARFQAVEKPSTPTVEPTITRIAFGSCSRQDQEQPLWPVIVQNQPQLWIWLGDNIYGDTQDMAMLKQQYALEKQHPGYRQLLSTCPVIGIWDDHDYGVNDGGKDFAKKAESQQRMLEFLDEPIDSPRWKREGAYASYLFGKQDKQGKVILLDGRYFRDELKKKNNKNVPNETGDILGEAQWAWLERELTNSQASIHFIGCGIQILPEEHAYEKWANFPQARRRLLDLIQKTKVKGVILLSGDRHMAEISRIQLDNYPYPLYEVTSSGLTHTWTLGSNEPNRYRVGQMVTELNFGLLEIHWDKQPLTIDIQVRGLNNKLLMNHLVTFGQPLTGK